MTDCPHPKSAKAKRCRACSIAHMNSDPAIAAKRAAGRKAYFDQPGVRMEYRERMRAITAATMADPVKMERKREHGRRVYRDVLSRPDIVAKQQAPEVRKRAGLKRTATVLRDIPPHLRDEYKALIRSKLIPAAQAREIILGQWKADIARRNSATS